MSEIIRTVIVAVDFGEASAKAVEVGGAIAGRAGASLQLVHAEQLDAPPYFTAAQMQALEGEARGNQRRAAEYLRAFGARHTSQPFDVRIESRAATEGILHASADAGLLVMGTHGRRGPSRWWLGSVAERVLRETAVPLLVVHAGGPEPADAMFAVGLVRGAPATAPHRTRVFAAELAAAFGGTLAESAIDDVRKARAEASATWAAIPAPTPRAGAWLSHTGEPLIRACAIPVLFVPEAEGGPMS